MSKLKPRRYRVATALILLANLPGLLAQAAPSLEQLESAFASWKKSLILPLLPFRNRMGINGASIECS